MSKALAVFYEFGGFRLDAVNRLLFRNSEVLPLTSKSIEILLVLAENEGSVVEKDELMSRVWPDSFVEEANLAHHVYLLRKALDDEANGTRFIQTIQRRGYRFVAEVRRTVNGSHADRWDAPHTGPQSPQEFKLDSSAQDFVTSRLQVDPRPIPNSFNGDAEMSARTSTGIGKSGAKLSMSQNLTSVETAQPGADAFSLRMEAGKRARIPISRASVRSWALVLIAVALLPGIVWFRSAHGKLAGEEQRSRVKTSPFTSLPGMENQPAFSPNGNQVAFSWNGENQDNVDIYVKLVGTESLLRFTTDPAQDTSPAWSPDGRFIAFRRNTREGSGFYLAPAFGGPERKIASAFPARAHYRGRGVDWTPDGKFLVVIDRDSEEAPFNISVLSVETGAKRRLVAPAAPSIGVMGLAVSADGHTVAFSQINPQRVDLARNQSDLYSVPFLGGAPKRLTFDDSWVSGMSWFPDGRDIVFVSQRRQAIGLVAPYSLWKISASGGEPIPLSISSRFGNFPSNPFVSRTGNRLVCEQRDIPDLDIWRAPGPHPSSDALFPAKLIASTWPETNPQFSPDGTRVAYSGGSSGALEIWVCNQEGHGCTQLTSMTPKQPVNPRWSADGSQIAFDADGDIYMVRFDGGSPRLLTKESSLDILPSWSRDDRWIYFGSARSGEWQIWKVGIEGGKATQVTQHGGIEAFESFDGQFLYFTRPIGLWWTLGSSSIWRMPVSGGPETRVVDRTSTGYWSLLNDGICYLDASGDLPFALQYLNFATGRTTKIGTIDQEPIWNSSSFSVSPDGRWMLYAQRPSMERDLMLVENFR